jgi:hypothetical protein
MAIDYTNLFACVRQYIKAANTLVGWSTVYDTASAAINGALVTATEYDLIAPVPAAFENYKDALVQTIGYFGEAVTSILADESFLAGQLPVGGSTSMNDILPALYRAMLDDSETVAASVLSVGAVSADAKNIGDATLLLNAVLDGATSPHNGWPTLRDYARDPAGVLPGTTGGAYVGLPSELNGGESFTVICASDSQTDGASEGGETFRIIGSDTPRQAYDWRSDGSGEGTLNMANGAGLLTNGEFETWTGTTPDFAPAGWTLGTGASVGTGNTIAQEATIIKRGVYALAIVGKSAVSTISISQAMTSLKPLKRYLVAVWMKTSGAGLANGALTISFTGTGYTAGATEKIALAQAALAALTTYTLKYFWVNMPESIPSDFALTITASSSLTNAEKIYFDGMVLAEATYFGGIAWAIVAGATPTLRDDRFTFTVTASEGGVQEFFRRVFHVQLPSTTGTESVTDTVTVFS